MALAAAAQQAMQGGQPAGQQSDPTSPDGTPEPQGDGSSDLIKALSAPAPAPQPNQRALDLRNQADAIPATGVEPITNWKQALMNVATKILPVALTAKFAGTAAGAGAGEGTLNATRQFALDQQTRRAQLLNEAQQAEQEDEKQREFNLEDQSRNQQIAGAAQRAQQEYALRLQEYKNTQTNADRASQERLAVGGLERDAQGNIVPVPKSNLPLTKQFQLDNPTAGAVTLQLPNGKKAPGKKDKSGNLLLADGSPAPSGTMLYQQPSYGQLMLPTKTTELLGPDNVMHRYQWDPETQHYDIDAGASPTGTAAHQIFQSGAIENLAPQVISDIQKNRAILGNLGSYYKQWLAGTPVSDPNAAQLMTELMSFAAMQPALHAFRSTNALDAFEKMIGGLDKNPDSTIATINGLLKTPKAFTGMVGRPGASGGNGAPPPGAKVRDYTQLGK